jgi:hypothetical protein
VDCLAAKIDNLSGEFVRAFASIASTLKEQNEAIKNINAELKRIKKDDSSRSMSPE